MTIESPQIKGQRIVLVRAMTNSEFMEQFWTRPKFDSVIVIVLENGVRLFASRDEEGNGPGAMFATDEAGTFVLSK